MWLERLRGSEVDGCMLIADVDRLHVKRNVIVGMNYLNIIDYRCGEEDSDALRYVLPHGTLLVVSHFMTFFLREPSLKA